MSISLYISAALGCDTGLTVVFTVDKVKGAANQ